MANEYLISKWKMWFTWLDINKDGILDAQDIESERQRFVELNEFSTEQINAAMEVFAKWWEEFIFCGKSELSEEALIKSFNDAFKANKKRFIEKMRRSFQVAYNVVDIHSNQCISEDEFIVGLRTSGHENIELNRRFFQMYNPVDGHIPVKELVESWVQFTTCEDKEKHDIVKTAFELGV
ncbi:sarcoplasmic calcium-binding protein-like [Ruditapes philippinarum]|uniref:sarcoplasmic calcium-binding protein-like n=1 Tax=Ruditapes philippinarum TaxID=129788 RepID=UPI00295AEBCC|nr:sarcoplasmic calcium-binding protein-like [Ruditapes philippinarum]XP_060599534.1 sarcoplasmic calcium-binding protein-like [Ruditapes philippinarum]